MSYPVHGVMVRRPFSILVWRVALASGFLLGVSIAAADTSTAWAQSDGEAAARERPWFADTTPAQRQRAREVFLEGNKLINVPNFRAAADKYQEAIAIWKNPAFYYNLAIAQVNLLRPVEAYESIQKALRFGEGPLGADKHRRALEVKKTLESELAWLDVVCDEPGAQVTLDGNALFVAPDRQRVVVRPGTHQLVATLAGRVPETRPITVASGEVAEIQVQLRLEKQVVHRRRWPIWFPAAVTAGSALFFGGAAYLDRSSTQRFLEFDASFDEACAATQGCRDGEFEATLNSAERRQNGARALYAVGSTVVVAGVVLFYLNREIAYEVGGESADRISIGPFVSRDGAGMSAVFRFQ